MAKSLIPNEKAIVDNRWNVLLIGPHGVGKSENVRGFADRHGLTWAMFNCATMDPYTDLVGVPMPRTIETSAGQSREVLKMIRPVAIDDAEVLFFDEVNRGGAEIHDAILEILNERTINGEPLPNLKCIFGAINPPGDDHGYHVQTLDPAFMDRFDQYVTLAANPSVDYMANLFGVDVARALVKWWKDADHQRRDTYLSPRRLVKLGKVYQATKERKSLEAAMPPGLVADTGKLFLMLQEASGVVVKPKAGDAKLAGLKEDAVKDGTVGTIINPPQWLKPPHGSDPARMQWAGKHTVDALKSTMATWSQPSQTRFKESLRALVDERRATGLSEIAAWAPVIEAINSFFATPKARVHV